MQQLFLTYYQRLILWNMVGTHTAPNLKETAVYLRIIEKIRLSDEENTESQFVNDGQRFAWRLPNQGYGDKTLELENAEAAALATAIEAATPIRVIDAEWLARIVEQLKPEGETKPLEPEVMPPAPAPLVDSGPTQRTFRPTKR
jgi:hypothetical protein